MPYQLSTALCPKYTDPLQVCVFRSVLTRGKAKAKPEGEVQFTWGKSQGQGQRASDQHSAARGLRYEGAK